MKDFIEERNFDELWALLRNGVCVKECPTADPTTTVDCLPTKEILDESDDYDGCVQMLDSSYFAKYKIDATYFESFPTVTDESSKYIGRTPYRYETYKLYGFCVPDLSPDGISALSSDTVTAFKELF